MDQKENPSSTTDTPQQQQQRQPRRPRPHPRRHQQSQQHQHQQLNERPEIFSQRSTNMPIDPANMTHQQQVRQQQQRRRQQQHQQRQQAQRPPERHQQRRPPRQYPPPPHKRQPEISHNNERFARNSLLENEQEEQETESLLVSPPNQNNIPETKMVEIVAPVTLPEYFQFEATVQNHTFLVSVPKGGVAEGEKFSVPLPAGVTLGPTLLPVPVGEWKDGFWDLFRYGYCHLSVLTSCCCTLLAIGQVISRLELSWNGTPGQHIHSIFHYYSLVVLCYWIIRAILFAIIFLLDPSTKNDYNFINGSSSSTTKNNYNDDFFIEEPSNLYYFFCALDDLLRYSFYGLCVYLTRNIRIHVRSKYAIPETEQCPIGYEDCCCSLVCPCLVIAQIMRHTADYSTYEAKCCSETGVSRDAPPIIV